MGSLAPAGEQTTSGRGGRAGQCELKLQKSVEEKIPKKSEK